VIGHGNAASVNNQFTRSFIIRNIVIPRAMDGIEFQKVRHDRPYGTIIDSRDFNFRLQQGRAECAPANSAKATDTYFYCHYASSLHIIQVAMPDRQDIRTDYTSFKFYSYSVYYNHQFVNYFFLLWLCKEETAHYIGTIYV
jgi:hypothetical protein